jgi:glycosyltransferase involved in cell wall biosynthesis
LCDENNLFLKANRSILKNGYRVKILLVNKFHYIRGGDSSYMFSLAELLKKNGHTILHFSMNHPLNFPCDQQKYFVDNIDFVEENRSRNLISGIRVLSRVIYSRQARLNISKLIEDTKPDIVHLNNIHAHITPSIIFELKKNKIPIVWTLHDYQLICPNTSLVSHEVICEACNGEKYFQCIIRKCKKDSLAASFVSSLEATIHKYMNATDLVSLFISPSLFLIDKFVQFGWDKKKLIHLPYFLTSEKFKANGSQRGSYVLFIGRLESYKGVRTLLNAAKLLNEIHIKIVGEGTEKHSLMNMAKEMKLVNVEFTGYLSGDALKRILHECLYVIVPSEWYENYPYAVMEAMAAGKPVIASRIGGLPEMIEEGKTGFLFEPKNYYNLAEKMRVLRNDYMLCETMGKEAKKKALINYNEDYHYEKMMGVYLKVLKGKSSQN